MPLPMNSSAFVIRFVQARDSASARLLMEPAPDWSGMMNAAESGVV